jgi:RNA polymerase-binding transcription factor DksA
MNDALNKDQLIELEARLKQRWDELKEIIRQELLESDDQRYIELAGQVHDLEEESVADLLVDTGLAVIDLHIREVRDIEQSLMRIGSGSYAYCIECGEEIDFLRLKAYPTATRCVRCQEVFEKTHAGNSSPRL